MNSSIDDIFQVVSKSLGGGFKKNWYGQPDFRSYEVDFRKASELLPNIQSSDTEEEIKRIIKFIEGGRYDYEKCITLGWYQNLLNQNPNLFQNK